MLKSGPTSISGAFFEAGGVRGVLTAHLQLCGVGEGAPSQGAPPHASPILWQGMCEPSLHARLSLAMQGDAFRCAVLSSPRTSGYDVCALLYI
jgi:hypothetical protein